MLAKSDFKIVFIIPYFGSFPSYFKYFLETCYHNEFIDFLIFTDNKMPAIDSANVRVHSMSMSEFNKLASSKCGFGINIKSGYKLCDFKPSYGHLFEDYIKEYDYWGFCDMDLILGDLSKVLTDKYLSSWDIISAHDKYLSGPFSLFRNNHYINRLYLKSKDIERVFTTDKVMLFDEASNVIHHLWAGNNIFDFESEVESMTHVLKDYQKCPFKVNFAGFITEFFPGELLWNDGVLIDDKGFEHAMYHFMWYKGNFGFGVPEFRSNSTFSFSEGGFHYKSFSTKYLVRCKSFFKNFTVRGYKKALKVTSLK